MFKACLDSQGNPFGVLAWTGEAPPPVTANGWESQVARAGDGSSLVVVTPSTAGTWNPIATTGKLSSFQGVTGCSSSGMWRIGPSGGGQVDLTSGVAQLTPVPAVPVEATRTSQVSIHSLLGSGPPLAAVQPAPTAASPDAPRTTSGYLWVGGKWDTTPTVSLGSGSYPFLNGGKVAATRLQPGTGQLKVVLK